MAGDYDNSKPHEYCVVHDRPLDWCQDPGKCREIMTGWGRYEEDPRPATMLQPVTFDDSPGEARPVRTVPVDEAEDDW